MTYIRTSQVSITNQPIKVSATSAIPANNYVFNHLKSKPRGVISMVTNAAGSSETFSFGSTGDVILYRCNISLQDTNMQPGAFGAISSLNTGVQIVVEDTDGSILFDFTADDKIKENIDWNDLAGVDHVIQDGTPDDSLTIRWTLERAGAPLYLASGQSFSFVIADDLTGLVSFEAVVQGVKA